MEGNRDTKLSSIVDRCAHPLDLGMLGGVKCRSNSLNWYEIGELRNEYLHKSCKSIVIICKPTEFSRRCDPKDLNVKKILLVDDDKTLQTLLRRYLTKRGYSVRVVICGVQGLKLFAQDPPDLVVSDIIMPRMNGLEFCRRLRATRPGQLVPFIFLSAKKDLEDRIQGHYIGADDYITKPFEPLELLAKIEAQLERSRRIHSEMVRLMQKVPEDNEGNEYGDNHSGSPAKSRDPEPEEDLPLTPAEARVFWEVIQGLTNKQISQRLFISPRTVQTHLSNILTKLTL